jgi:hypothetical protein
LSRACDDRLGLVDRRAARIEVQRHDLRQVVHRIEEYVIELAHLGLDVARHGEIDHEHRPPAPRAQRALDQPLAEDRQRRGSGGHDDVVFVQVLGQ